MTAGQRFLSGFGTEAVGQAGVLILSGVVIPGGRQVDEAGEAAIQLRQRPVLQILNGKIERFPRYLPGTTLALATDAGATISPMRPPRADKTFARLSIERIKAWARKGP